MNSERMMQVLLSPHVSEKSTLLADRNNTHVFRVVCDATRGEVKQAVETLFNVKVSDVKILNVKGKTKRFGGRLGKRSDWRKAYVRLLPDNEIDLSAIG